MSYSIDLYEDGEIVRVSNHNEGAIMAIGGSEYASMNVTYNYSEYYYACLDEGQGIYWLSDKKASDVIERLEYAVKILGTYQSKDYWESTPGNAGYALSILLEWAKLHPNAEWKVS